MELLQHYTKLQTFIPAFTAEPDAVFALNNMTALLERTDWKQVRKDILTTDADWLELKDKLVFSDDFVEQNRETVTEFLLRGGAAMVRALYGELDGQELAVEALVTCSVRSATLSARCRRASGRKIFLWPEVHFWQKRWMIFTTLCGLGSFLMVPACLTVLEARESAC